LALTLLIGYDRVSEAPSFLDEYESFLCLKLSFLYEAGGKMGKRKGIGKLENYQASRQKPFLGNNIYNH